MHDSPQHDNDLERALLDAVTLFDELSIGYALIGGLAAMIYGKSRFTEDVDFVADPGHMDVLVAHPEAMRRHGFDPQCTWKLYHDSGITIDIWKDDYAQGIVQRAEPVQLAGRSIAVARVEDLVAMKLRSDRPQDEYDISEILKAGTLDSDKISTLITSAQAQRLDQIRRRIGLG